jgi:hypothetical protein
MLANQFLDQNLWDENYSAWWYYGYPPEWDEEVFERVLEQAENFKKWAE